MARYFEVSRSLLKRHGATVEKFIRDAVMAVFGVPVVHEDEPGEQIVPPALCFFGGLAGVANPLIVRSRSR